MSCREIRDLLSDYVDGELSSAAERRVGEHVDGCQACRRTLTELSSLLDAAGALARDVEPERNLWSGIEQRIQQPEPAVARGSWWSASWVGLAAAAVLVLAVILQVSREDEPLPASPSPDVAEAAPSYALISEEVRARNGLLQVRKDLLRAIGERRASLDPKTQELVDHNLVLIDQAIAEIYQALEENPENRELEFLLAATYQREVEFLKNMNLL